nr:MAG: hypothetical protein [Partitiviridae sp.]
MNQKEQSLPTASVTSARPKKRQGKGSKTRNTESYRLRVGEKVVSDLRRQLEANLKLLDTEDVRPIENTINNIQLTSQPKAAPFSVTTRGIGFSTAIFYDRIIATWNMHAISEIANIHQVYRVHLWMAHYKMYLAQQLQTEMCSGYNSFEYIDIPYEIKCVLDTIAEVPSLISFTLGCMGKMQNGNRVYHMGYSKKPAERNQLEYYTLCVNPDNIRGILNSLDASSDAEMRNEYFRYNSIPGLRVVNGVLMNADEVYPEGYDADMLREDVHSYKNLLTRVQSRLPKHVIRPFSWHGRAVTAGLVSCARLACNVTAKFKAVDCSLKRARVRTNDGEPVEVVSAGSGSSVFERSIVVGEHGQFWTVGPDDHQQNVLGAMSMVGEECFMCTRYEINSAYSYSSDPITTMFAVVDAPR